MRLTAWVVTDVGEEVDATAEPREADGDIERAAADVLADDLAVALDDVDQRLTDDQRALLLAGSHVDSFRIRVSSVALAPSRCSESSAQSVGLARTGQRWRDPRTPRCFR